MNYRRYDLGFVPTADQAIKIERVRSLTGRPIKDCVQALISEEWGVVDAVVDLRADDKKSTVKTHTVPNSVTVQIVLAAGHHPKHVAVVRRDVVGLDNPASLRVAEKTISATPKDGVDKASRVPIRQFLKRVVCA